MASVTKPVGQLKFNGFKVVGDIFLKVQVTDDPPRWHYLELTRLTRFTMTDVYDVLSIKIWLSVAYQVN